MTYQNNEIIIDGQGVAVLLPVVQLPPKKINGEDYITRALKGGLTSLNISLGIEGIGVGVDNFRSFIDTIHSHYCYFEIEPRLLHILSVSDILKAKKKNKLGVIFGVQGLAKKIDSDPALIRIVHKLGLRIGQLTYNEVCAFGCGYLEKNDTGLTQIGRNCIREMNHIGICVDLSHCGEKTMIDAMNSSNKPVIISHGNPKKLCDTPRNISDDALKELKNCNGVIGVTAYGPLCETKKDVLPKLDDMIDHISYVVDLVGIDHVGIGTDFFESESEVRFESFFKIRYPETFSKYSLENVYFEDFKRVEHFPQLKSKLLKKGFKKEEVSKILGGNFLRVFENVW